MGMSILYLCTCQSDTDLQKEISRWNCTQDSQSPWESPTAKLSSKNPNCNPFTASLVPCKLGLSSSSGCFKLCCLWKCHPPVCSHTKWAIFPPQSLHFSQGKRAALAMFFTWVHRNIFLQPGQGIPPGRTSSGLAHKVKSASPKYNTSKEPLDTPLWVTGTDFRWVSEFKAKLNGIYCSETSLIFNTFLRLVIMHFWFTVLMPGNRVTFILPCRITWEYSLERISHWAKVKKQSRHVASSKVPSCISEI